MPVKEKEFSVKVRVKRFKSFNYKDVLYMGSQDSDKEGEAFEVKEQKTLLFLQEANLITIVEEPIVKKPEKEKEEDKKEEDKKEEEEKKVSRRRR